MKTNVVAGIDLIQASVSGTLKGVGFTKRGRTYNRIVDDGLVHAINFQAGPYPIGDQNAIPGLRENLYGTFAVNLGIYLPFVSDVETGIERPQFIKEPFCHVRTRLGTLIHGMDYWWSALESLTETAELFPSLMVSHAFPFFDRFRSYEMVLSEWRQLDELPFCNAGRTNLLGGIILARLGQHSEAITAFHAAIESNSIRGFHDHVRSIAARLGNPLTHDEK